MSSEQEGLPGWALCLPRLFVGSTWGSVAWILPPSLSISSVCESNWSEKNADPPRGTVQGFYCLLIALWFPQVMGSWVFLGGVGDRIWSLLRKRKYLQSRQFSDLIMFGSPWKQTCSKQANGASSLCSVDKTFECQDHKDFYPTQRQSNYKIIVNDKVGAQFLRGRGKTWFLYAICSRQHGDFTCFHFNSFSVTSNSINKNLRIVEL